MTTDSERRAQIIASSARRAAAAAMSSAVTGQQSEPQMQMAPAQVQSVPTPVVAPAPAVGQVFNRNKDYDIKVVPHGTKPSQAGQRPVTTPGRVGNVQTVTGGRPGGPRQSNVTAASGSHAPRTGSNIQQTSRTGAQQRPVSQAQAVRTSGVVATPRVVAPVPTQSSAPTVDASVVLAYHMRPGTVEKQQRMLIAQSVQPVGSVSWLNPPNVGRFPDAIQAILDQRPNVKPNLDMGPWARWSLAAVCTTEFFVILDDDCNPGPRWLELALQRLASAGQQDVVCAGGALYRTDACNDQILVGPEAPPTVEVEVDIGRGGWVMRTELARLVVAKLRFSELLSTGLHVASVCQELDGVQIVMPYAADHTNWGMLEPLRAEGSVTMRLHEAAAAGQSESPEVIADSAYKAYREEGWMPSCVVNASVDTVRTEPVSEVAQ